MNPRLTSPKRRRRRRLRQALALCVSAVALAGTAGAADASAAGPFTLSYTSVDRLTQSTGNLYWTSHYINEFGPSAASVYRASKSNSPGQEAALYTEYLNGWIYFGDLEWAYTSNSYYGFFVANYPSSNVSRIKRVPLAGGAAVTLATSPSFVGMRDLATDGTYLFWADDSGLRRMPIGGGTVSTIVAGSGIQSVGVNSTRVYYSQGASIRSVAKLGGSVFVHAWTGSTVTTMHLYNGSGGTTVYWGEQNAAIRSISPTAAISTHQSPLSGRRAWSVSFDGSRVLWTDCTYPNGNGCAVRKRQSWIGTTSIAVGVGADNVQGDASAMFYSDQQLKKIVH